MNTPSEPIFEYAEFKAVDESFAAMEIHEGDSLFVVGIPIEGELAVLQFQEPEERVGIGYYHLLDNGEVGLSLTPQGEITFRFSSDQIRGRAQIRHQPKYIFDEASFRQEMPTLFRQS